MAENSTRELPTNIQEAEAIARADESRASIMRRKALTDANFKEGAEEAARNAKESSDYFTKLQDEAVNGQTDLSGVTRTLSDSAGNFAPNIDVATAGGIGVEASNSVAGTEQQATSSDQVESPEDAAKRLASQGTGGAQPVEIPADWEASHWRTRQALAERISGRSDVKAEEANGIISAEVERRKA